MSVAKALGLFKKPLICFAGVTSLSVSAAHVHAQAPDLEEARSLLIEQGLSPEQVEEFLNNLTDGAVLGAGDVLATEICEDSNDNDICDDEENDSEVTSCRVSYLDAITKFAIDNYGTRLGDDPIGIALTCQASAVNESQNLTVSVLPGVLSGGRESETVLEYWDTVMRQGGESSPSLRRRYERIERLSPALRQRELPSDLRPLTKIGDELDSQSAHVNPAEKAHSESLLRQYNRLALPVQRRCENIRRNVGAYYRAQYPDGAVCLVNVPVADDELEDER